MLSRSELLDRLYGIADEIAAMAVQPVLTVADERRFEALQAKFDRLDFARIGLEVGVREADLPAVVALLTG